MEPTYNQNNNPFHKRTPRPKTASVIEIEINALTDEILRNFNCISRQPTNNVNSVKRTPNNVNRNNVRDPPKSKPDKVTRALPQNSNSSSSLNPRKKMIDKPGSSNNLESLDNYKTSAPGCSFWNNQHEESDLPDSIGPTDNARSIPDIFSWNPSYISYSDGSRITHCNASSNINTSPAGKREFWMPGLASSEPNILHIPSCGRSRHIKRGEQQRSNKRRSEESEKNKKPTMKADCGICLEPLDFLATSDEKRVMSAQCGHLFCNSCIVTALENREVCPKCIRPQVVSTIHRVYL